MCFIYIAHYIANELREPGIANKLIGRIREAVMSLAQLPTRYALVSDEHLRFKEYGKRWWIATSFSMLYLKKLKR